MLDSPIPTLEELATRLIAPVVEGPPDIIRGLMPRQGQLVISGETNVGKAQPLDAKVLTFDGWKQLGDLQLGDVLVSPDNTPSSIVAIHPRGERQVYRITFTDGRTTEACAEHLWRVYHPNWMEKSRRKGSLRKPKLMSTEEIMNSSKTLTERLYIDLPEDMDYGLDIAPPINPWLLGMLIGDGSLSSHIIEFTTADPHIVDRAKSSIDSKLLTIHKKPSAPITYSIVKTIRKGGGPNPLKTQLETMGLMGCRSYEKFIPDCYLGANRTTREGILSGLMDTDGFVSKTGLLQYTTTSPKLAEQVVYLVRSLGGFAKSSSKMGVYKDKNGVHHKTRTAYTINIGHSTPKRFVSLPRKLDRLKDKRRSPRLRFASIEVSRRTETRCITVSHPHGLYITDNFTVTHNSLLALEICSALTTGAPLWGELAPTLQARKVVYVLGEHYREVIQRLWQHTGLPMTDNVWLLGPEELSFDKWLVSMGRPNLQAISKFKKWCDGADLVVFDPLSAFVSGIEAEQDNITMRLVLDSMSMITQASGASCLILAHQGKPQMDQKGQEHARKSYAIRGASGTEDAATNIFYMGKAESDPSQAAARGNIFELKLRKYKGEAPSEYRLLRDPGNLTHQLLGNKPYAEILKIEAQQKVARLQASFPDYNYRTCIRIVAGIEGVAEETIKRRLGVVS